ncbi:unnamed protein product [Rhodiola kirilowii]
MKTETLEIGDETLPLSPHTQEHYSNAPSLTDSKPTTTSGQNRTRFHTTSSSAARCSRRLAVEKVSVGPFSLFCLRSVDAGSFLTLNTHFLLSLNSKWLIINIICCCVSKVTFGSFSMSFFGLINLEVLFNLFVAD